MLHIHRGRGPAVMVAACAIGLLASGCAAPGAASPAGPRDSALIVRDSSNRHTVTVAVGQDLEVILGSSYWNVQGSSQPHVLKQDGPTTLMPRPADCAANIPGLGCVPVRTDFSALTPGTTVITASRNTCGEAMRCMPNQEHYSLTVVVRATT